MKGSDVDFCGDVDTHQMVHALSHFAGSFVSEGDGENFTRGNPLLEQVGDTVRQDTCLA
jgi:hypothetical protein